ncbi:hypothetical protein CVT26_008850 [Gymnopilus dilepis]|uniref:HD domain-containing protein n=1 Tax=Gymnopilus dilepis TaxID=231916 RepID=A0A409WP48_9AGAR|nr:hypothetical protein CVT26_008850 [Gymnopilus dilepis]
MNPSSSSYLDYERDEDPATVESTGKDSKDPERHIKDPIHDYIPISAKLSRFIDTKQFQRLRLIKQLGTTSYVWPSASHTRFEHCLGVAYLAREMVTHIQKSQPELGVTDRDVDCVEIAGLCHDLGHGPWSHVWDGMFIPVALPDTKWQHEMGSEMMFDALIADLPESEKIPLEDQNFIKALIAGDHSRTPHEKAFLFDIVANKRNGLDVDKFDYIHRDSHMIGEPISLSLVRLVNSARVLDDQICYDIKDANHIYDICVARFKLHKTIYNHKAVRCWDYRLTSSSLVAKAIEYMIIDGLLKAEPHLKIAERVLDPKKYLHLTDDIMPFIEASEDPQLAESRAIFDRIRTRQLYKCVDFKVIDWPMRHLFREHVTPTRIVEECKRILAENSARSTASSTPSTERSETESLGSEVEAGESGEEGGLSISDVIVDFSTMHYGMKDKNPVDSVRFYSKRRPRESMQAGPGEYSNLRPLYFAEELLRVYTKKAEYFGLIQAGYRAVLAQMEKEQEAAAAAAAAARASSDAASAVPQGGEAGLKPTVTGEGVDAVVSIPAPAPTPPATEAPSTPTASATHSRHASIGLPVPPPLSLVGKGEGSFSSVASAGSSVLSNVTSTPSASGSAPSFSMAAALSTTTALSPAAVITTSVGTALSGSAGPSVTSTPFGPNKFMTVSPTYVPSSPTRSARKARLTRGTASRKRLRDESPTAGAAGGSATEVGLGEGSGDGGGSAKRRK